MLSSKNKVVTISCIFLIVYLNFLITVLWIFGRFACKLGDLWNHWQWVMMVGRIYSCMVVGMKMGERFLVRMLHHS